MLAQPLLLSASTDTPVDTDCQEIPEKEKKRDPGRKRMPSLFQNSIFFKYNSSLNRCEFYSLPENSSLSVVIIDSNGNTKYGVITESNPYWYISLASDNYYITCTSDNGSTFEGYIYI